MFDEREISVAVRKRVGYVEPFLLSEDNSILYPAVYTMSVCLYALRETRLKCNQLMNKQE